MDIQPNNQSQSISDDQELAKVLAGVSEAGDGNLNFEETNPPAAPEPQMDPAVFTPLNDPSVAQPMAMPEPSQGYAAPDPQTAQASAIDPALDQIKQAALSELRPLVDKLDVPAEEKFDTYLLLLRSTDDRDLIAPAHEAAKAIVDESRRAQALLDIIKEIDFLSSTK